MIRSMSSTVVCPWCWAQFDSQAEWADTFAEKHPLVARVDAVVPVLNTPSLGSR